MNLPIIDYYFRAMTSSQTNQSEVVFNAGGADR